MFTITCTQDKPIYTVRDRRLARELVALANDAMPFCQRIHEIVDKYKPDEWNSILGHLDSRFLDTLRACPVVLELMHTMLDCQLDAQFASGLESNN
jgi:hypothetical protein